MLLVLHDGWHRDRTQSLDALRLDQSSFQTRYVGRSEDFGLGNRLVSQCELLCKLNRVRDDAVVSGDGAKSGKATVKRAHGLGRGRGKICHGVQGMEKAEPAPSRRFLLSTLSGCTHEVRGRQCRPVVGKQRRVADNVIRRVPGLVGGLEAVPKGGGFNASDCRHSAGRADIGR